MAFFYSPPRQAHTSQICPYCAGKLDINRTCREAYMHCQNCKQSFPIEPFIPTMDESMEEFLESMFADRV